MAAAVKGAIDLKVMLMYYITSIQKPSELSPGVISTLSIIALKMGHGISSM